MAHRKLRAGPDRLDPELAVRGGDGNVVRRRTDSGRARRDCGAANLVPERRVSARPGALRSVTRRGSYFNFAGTGTIKSAGRLHRRTKSPRARPHSISAFACRPLRRSDVDLGSSNRGWASPLQIEAVTRRSSAAPSDGRSKRRTTRTFCSRVQRAPTDSPTPSSARRPVEPLKPGRRVSSRSECNRGWALGRRRRQLSPETHDERLRLRRALRHADRLPDQLGQVRNQQRQRESEPRAAPRLQRIHRARPQRCALLQSGERRAAVRFAAPIERVPNRSRPEIPADHKPAVSVDARHGAWVGFTWRYDSGLVAGEVAITRPPLVSARMTRPAIGLYCGGLSATPTAPLTTAIRLNGAPRVSSIPADGTEDDDTQSAANCTAQPVRSWLWHRQPVRRKAGRRSNSTSASSTSLTRSRSTTSSPRSAARTS